MRDTGVGIPAGSLSEIFNMFSQVGRGAGHGTGGLGIGLALVKGLVEMHGGTVAAASPGENRGSTFTVTLPALAEADEPATPAGDTPGVTARRVLVVDDNRDGADSLALMLRLLGHEVRTAHDGVEAVDQAEAFRPAVILMDVGMPRLNGLDATRRIRAAPWGAAVTVIAVTGWGQEADRVKAGTRVDVELTASVPFGNVSFTFPGKFDNVPTAQPAGGVKKWSYLLKDNTAGQSMTISPSAYNGGWYNFTYSITVKLHQGATSQSVLPDIRMNSAVLNPGTNKVNFTCGTSYADGSGPIKEPFLVRLYGSKDGTLDGSDVRLDEMTVSGNATAGSFDLSRLKIDGYARLFVVANANYAVAESDYYNNQAEAVVAKPDVRLVSATAEGSNLKLAFDFTGVVRAFNVQLYLAAQPYRTGGDTPLWNINITHGGAEGKGFVATLPIGNAGNGVRLPGVGLNDPGTDYYILAVANTNQKLDEANSGNNTAALSGYYYGDNKKLFVHGTDGADTVQLLSSSGAAPSGFATLTLNGRATGFAVASYNAVAVRGHGGDDSFVFNAGKGFTTRLEAGFWGGYGKNTASLTGTPSQDEATLRLKSTGLEGTLNGYSHYSLGFNRFTDVKIVGGGGSYDKLDFDDLATTSAGAINKLEARPQSATIKGANFSVQALNVSSIQAKAAYRKAWEAYIYDSTGNDRFTADPTGAYMQYNLQGANIQTNSGSVIVENFGSVTAHAGAGGTDTAELKDSAGNDTFVATPTTATLYNTDFRNQANGFRTVTAHASRGYDSATLQDSAGDDTFSASPTTASLKGAGFHDAAVGFDYVLGLASKGGKDTAVLTDSSGNDSFAANPLFAELGSLGVYKNRAEQFEVVRAEATRGGFDSAHLGGTTGRDFLKASSLYADLSGTNYSIFAKGFSNVGLDAGGGYDQAAFYDSAWDDSLYLFSMVNPTVTLTSAGRYSITARNFDWIRAVAQSGGRDTALVYDQNPQAPLPYAHELAGAWAVQKR